MPTAYRVEIETNNGLPRSVAVIEQPEVTGDYLTLESTKIVCPIVEVETGDRAIVKDSDNQIIYEGFVDSILIDQNLMTLTAKPVLSLLDFQSSMLRWYADVGAVPLRTVLNGTYRPMGEDGLHARIVTFTYPQGGEETLVRVPTTNEMYINVMDFVRYLFNEYGISLNAYFNDDGEVTCEVYTALEPVSLDLAQPFVLDKEIDDNKDDAYNVVQVINTRTATFPDAYIDARYFLLMQDGTIETATSEDVRTKVEGRVFPVRFVGITIDCDDSDYDLVAMTRAKEILSNAKYANEIRFTIRNDNLVIDSDLPYGTPLTLTYGDTVYITAVTGKIVQKYTTTYICGNIRSELTKQMTLNQSSSTIYTGGGGGGTAGVIDVQVDNTTVVDDNKIAKIQSKTFVQKFSTTEETIVGYWINGKPIHRKVWYKGNIASGSSSLNVSLDNPETIVAVAGIADEGSAMSNAHFQLPYVNPSDARYEIGLFYRSGAINFRAGTAGAGKNAYVWIDYTKTTEASEG